MSKTIKVTINPVGKPTVEADGFMGGECQTATKPITDALGGSRSDNEVVDEKPEMHVYGGEEEQSEILTN